jgi:vacuolar protein sorting-associated protein 13A/C
LGKAGKGVALGIGRGLAGIFMDPVKGAQEGAKESAGAAVGGFFKGVGQGILGIVVKPAAAVVSGTATVMDGINNNVSLDTAAQHVRYPRFLQYNIICDYSDREGLACIIFTKIQENISHAQVGDYIFHFMLDGDATTRKKTGSRKKTVLVINV